MTKLPKYKISIDPEFANGEDLGIEQIAFTSNPAIKVKGMAFVAAPIEKKLCFADGVKMRIAAPALIPMEIYRNDEDGEYFVEFTVQEIEAIHSKFMLNLNNQDKFNLEHNSRKTVPAYILETWIVDEPLLDKSYSTFGIEVPKGTLMVVSQLTDKEYYASLVENGQIGYSIEGFLGLALEDLIKNKKQNNTMILKDGTTFSVDEKQYIVLAGVITETELAKPVEEPVVEEEPVEEKLAEPSIEEKPIEAPVIDEAKILAIIQPKLDEIYKLIADLKAEEITTEDTTEVTPVETKMSIHDKFAAVMQLVKE